MRSLISMLVLMCLWNCSNSKTPLKGDTEFQRQMNADFKDASKSPLESKDLKAFNGLDFFPFDNVYVVNAKLERTPNSEWFNMRTTTDRVSKERIFGVLSFQLKDKSYKLNVYQGEENLNTEGLEDYLFLPFLDDTNGETTYGGGRYIDLKIPEGDSIEIDFNRAYNPYCVYNKKYSCPIVPRQNYVDTEIKAGVRMFEKE